MRIPRSNSATSNGPGDRRTRMSFRHALIFAVGAACGSILATLIGLEYTSWIIIVACWPLALLFSLLERPRERRLRLPSAGRPWYARMKRSMSPAPGRPPLRPGSKGLRRVK
jgi:uncharacterized membrane protein YfcA